MVFVHQMPFLLTREQDRQGVAYLLRAPPLLQLGLHEVPQHAVLGQFARSGPGPPGQRLAVRTERPVVPGAADVAPDLPADRRGASAQLGGNGPLGVARREQVTELDPFLLR